MCRGAVNVPNSEIVINVPVDNSSLPRKKFTKVIQAAGISDDTLVVAYNVTKWPPRGWPGACLCTATQNVKVVSGGIDAIGAAGLP